MVMINKRVERVTADEANLTFPPISPDITTETVAVGTANIVTATCMGEEGIPPLQSRNIPIPGSNRSFSAEDDKSHIKYLGDRDKDRDAPIIKRAIGRAIPEIIFSELFIKPGNFKLKKENIIPINAETIIGLMDIPLSMLNNDLNKFLCPLENILQDKIDNIFWEIIMNGARKLAIPRPLLPNV